MLSIERSCPYLITPDKYLLKEEEAMIPREGIPTEGLCSVRRIYSLFGQILKNCERPWSPEDCHFFRHNDFCKEWWAANF